MAAGANLREKLFGMVKTIGPVFQSYAPGLGLFDLAVGVAGAVILYFVVQSKIKKDRKFRRDMEYGSARWGTEADIKPLKNVSALPAIACPFPIRNSAKYLTTQPPITQ